MKGGPRCPCCGQTTGPFAVGPVVKVQRVDGRLLPTAWVICCRPVVGMDTTCGWSWWSRHPDLVARAKRKRGFKLVRAKQGTDRTPRHVEGGRWGK